MLVSSHAGSLSSICTRVRQISVFNYIQWRWIEILSEVFTALKTYITAHVLVTLNIPWILEWTVFTSSFLKKVIVPVGIKI